MDAIDPFTDDLNDEERERLERIDRLVAPLPRAIARRRAQEEIEQPTIRQEQAASPSWFIPPPWGWDYPVAGRQGSPPDPLLMAFGQYIKRARYLSGTTQRRLSTESGVDQGLISRLERAKAPWMRVDRLVLLGDALGRMLPLGYCPHEHWCQWQPAPKPPPEPPIDKLSPKMREILNSIRLGE